MNDTTSPARTQVHIRVAKDDDASRISAVLEALGYNVLRELDEGDGPQRLRWAVTRLARRHKLTSREQSILELVLEGRSNAQIGRSLDISRATVKWHMHNVFAKTNTGTRESLLRLALQLGGKIDEAAHADDSVDLPTVDEPAANDGGGTGGGTSAPPFGGGFEARSFEVIPAAAVPSKSWF